MAPGERKKKKKKQGPMGKYSMLLVVLLFGSFMAASIIQLPWTNELTEIPTEDVGSFLFEDYWFALILVGLGIVAAILGGIYLAKVDTKIFEDEFKKEDEK
jgi:NADH:ubiquinone oxidoreductase subunit 6 (subunit J)